VDATSIAVPACAVGSGPRRSARETDERRERKHARHVDGHHETDDLERAAVVAQVQRRHRHHRHHDAVGRHHGNEPGARGAVAQHDAQLRDSGSSRRGCFRGLETSGDDERVGSQEQPDDRGRHREPHECHHERAGQGRQSEPIPESASGTERIRTRDGTDCGRPHNGGDGPRPVFRRGEVGTRIASEQVRCGARSHQDHPGQQQQERLDLGGDHRGPGTSYGRDVATDEPGPSPAP
jgi:hypothetical protein